MQKQVSKQSLAVLALSILLAISMALTATFAAFANSSTVTGTIKFSGNVVTAVTKTGLTETTPAANGTDGVYTFTLDTLSIQETTAAGLVDDLAVGLADSSDSAFLQITFAMEGVSIITLNDVTTYEGWTKNANGDWASNAKIGAGTMINLTDLIGSIVINQAGDISEITTEIITVTVNASASNTYVV